MTREIAKRIVKGITDKIECNTADIDDWAEFWGFTREEYEEFLDMAIKSQEPKSEWQKDHEILKAYSDGANEVLDKIYTDIQKLRGCSCSCSDGIIDDVEDILDKYKGESEG
jgi:hypothetical protein